MQIKLISFILIFLSYSLTGQKIMPEILSSSGGLHSGQNANLSWTLGELSIKTFTTDDMMLTQGFQQPYLYVNSTFNPESKIEAIIYPNPAIDFINIDFKYTGNNLFTLSIIDINGNILKHINLKKNKKINISNLDPGYYFIAINSGRGIELTGIKFLKLK